MYYKLLLIFILASSTLLSQVQAQQLTDEILPTLVNENNIEDVAEDTNCLHYPDLNSKDEKVNQQIGNCVYQVLLQRGYKPCDKKCVEKLSSKEKAKHYDNLVRFAHELLNEERERRKVLGYNKKSK